MAEVATNNDLVYTSAEESRPIQIDDPIDAEHEVDGDKAISTSTEHTSIHKSSTPPTVQQAAPVKSETADASTSKPPVEVKKSLMSVSPSKKANGGPPTPTVKKIINSGTFGAGSLKATAPKDVTPAPPTAKVTAPVLKKTSTTPPSISKPTLASTTPAKPAAASSVPTRRASIVPTRPAAPPVRTSLSASARPKPALDSDVRSRGSVASPTGSVASAKAAPVARPRASVSEAVKKPPVSSRPSIASSVKPTGPARAAPLSRSSVTAPGAKSTRTASISSIREVKEDNKALLELQSQLDEATKVLEEKAATVSSLEEQLATVEASLTTASETSESQASRIKEMEGAKGALENTLEEIRKALEQAQQQLEESTSSFQSVQSELETSKAAANAQIDVVAKLESRIQELEAALVASKEELEAFKQASAGVSASLEAASIDRSALLKAQSDFNIISEEAEALKAAHTQALQDSENRIAELQTKIAESESLEVQLAALKAEKEENATKLSELEIEILELKETQDDLEDTRDSLRRQVANLENELAKAAVSGAMAGESSSQREAEHEQKLAELFTKHQQELETEAGRYAEVVGNLEALKLQLAETQEAHEQSKEDLLCKEERHSSKVIALQESFSATEAALLADIAKVTKELESQESIYNSKVNAVKAEHAQLLEEAFEKAKSEAAAEHSKELQAFRASSNATIEEIKSANKTALDSLKADQASSLENEVSTLQKQISKLNLELKATQDDLFKAKQTLEAAHFDVDSLTKQRNAFVAQAGASRTPTPERNDELRRIQNQLSHTRDDLKAVTELLNFTKQSMTELSERHKMELEEAAQGRADELLKLRATHDEEVTTFASAKSDLLIRLSDLEGELASARAALAAQQTASPRSNSYGPSPSTSFATKEELTKLHEAHNLKMNDLEAAHEKAMKLLREELEASRNQIGDLTKEVAHKDMEIGYMRTDQEESDETITRLKADIDALSGQP